MEQSHLTEVNEGYFKHMFNSLKYCVKLLMASLACIVHAIFPELFKHTASNIARDISYDAELRRQRKRY